MNANVKRIEDFAVKGRLPSMSVRRESVDAGGLISYGADLVDQYRQGSPLDATDGSLEKRYLIR
jgi:hypothetical protein